MNFSNKEEIKVNKTTVTVSSKRFGGRQRSSLIARHKYLAKYSGRIQRYSEDYHDIQLITMIFVPFVPTETDQEITTQQLICGFVKCLFPVKRLEILRQQFMAT